MQPLLHVPPMMPTILSTASLAQGCPVHYQALDGQQDLVEAFTDVPRNVSRLASKCLELDMAQSSKARLFTIVH